MLSNGHAGLGERPGETDLRQHRHRAPGRLNRDWGTPDGGIRVVLYDKTSLERLNLSDGQVESTSFAGRAAKVQREALGPGDCSGSGLV